MVSLISLGHAGFVITEKDQSILVDPWTENKAFPEQFKDIKKSFPNVVGILVTHGHKPHLGDSNKLAELYNCCLFTNHEVSLFLIKHLNLSDKLAIGMNVGGTVDFHGWEATYVPAAHSSSCECSSITSEYTVFGGFAGGWIIRTPSKRIIYYSGDTGITSDIKLISKVYKPEIAILPLGGHYCMGKTEVAYCINHLLKDVKVFTTWSSAFIATKYEVRRDKLEDVMSLLTRKDVEVIKSEPGKEILLENKEEKKNYDFLIIGGGIAGLATAISLLKIGLKVKVFERLSNEFIIGNGAGISLVDEILDVLKSLGISKEAIESSFVKPKQELYYDSDMNLLKKVCPTNKLNASWVGLYQVLLNHLPKGFISFSSNITEYNESNEGVSVLCNNELFYGKNLLIADGSRSVFRSKIISKEVKYTGFLNWRGLVDDEETLQSFAQFYPEFKESITIEFGNNIHTGWQILPDKRLSWWMYLTLPDLDFRKVQVVPSQEDIDAFLLSVKRKVSEGLYFLISNTKRYLVNVINDMDPLTQWVYGRKMFIGDSAHPITPNCGLGACGAIIDAYSLGNILKNYKDDLLKGLHVYESKRIEAVGKVVLASRNTGIERNSYSKDKDFNKSYDEAHKIFISKDYIIHDQ